MKRKKELKSWNSIGTIQKSVQEKNKEIIRTNDIYIPSIQAKDIFLGLRLHDKNGNPLIKKYIATLDYSKEQVKLKEVFQAVYPKKRMITPLYDSKNQIIKLFCDSVISVDYKYSVKEWNQKKLYDKEGKKHKAYIKYGYEADISIDKFHDCVAKVGDNVVGILVEEEIQELSEDVFCPFLYSKQENCYKIKDSNNKTMWYLTEEKELALDCETMRILSYEHGFDYNGIHYIRWKRATGASRKGSCLFIDEMLYPLMREWERMGIPVTNQKYLDLAGEEAYIALTLSGCQTKEIIHINKDEILVVDEKTDSFISNCIGVSNTEDGLIAEKKEVTITNNLFDGESLIEAELCHGYGMSLLRERWCKTCAFATRIQDFFHDKGITKVSQLNGFTLAKDIKQIKLILNPTCIKFLKFNSNIEDWLNQIDGDFYVIKHEHETGFFDNQLVQAHYQLLNTLQLSEEETKQLLQPSFDYINAINTDVTIFQHYIAMKYKEKYEMSTVETTMDSLLNVSDKAFHSKYCKKIKKDIRKSFRKNLTCGHILIHGNYSVLFGNPLHYLYHAIGEFDSCKELNGNQCMTINKNFGKEPVVLCRSPHVAVGNLALLENVYVKEIDQYFALSDNIVCINAIGENIMERLSSCDYDSDQAIITNEKIVVQATKKNYDKFGVPTSLVKPKASNKYYYTMQDLAKLDNITKRQSATIGEIINFSQVLQSFMWDNINHKNVCLVEDLVKDCAILDIMSCICIDSAKKDYSNINLSVELNKLRDKYRVWIENEDGKITKPTFFKQIEQRKNYDKSDDRYRYYDTTMCYVNRLMDEFRCQECEENTYTLADILTIQIPCEKDRIAKSQIVDMLQKAEHTKRVLVAISKKKQENWYQEYQFEKNAYMEYVKSRKINVTTAYKIIRLLDSNHKKIRQVKQLVTEAILNHDIITSLVGAVENEYYEIVPIHQEITVADYILYGIPYKKVLKNPPIILKTA